MTRSRRVHLEAAYLLHHRPFRDTSRIIDLLTRDHGRVSLFARGVRGPKSRFGALLQPFVPLLASWAGSGDGGTLAAVEPAAETGDAPFPAHAPPPAPRLMSAYYLNELCLNLIAREDPQPEIFESYRQALIALATAADEAWVLRLFEKRLLDALGLGIDYAHLVGSGEPVEPDAYYHVPVERGVIARVRTRAAADCYRGAHLLALAGESPGDREAVAAARRLLGRAIAQALDGRELASRGVAKALRAAQHRPLGKGES